jgi:hypothetical protein
MKQTEMRIGTILLQFHGEAAVRVLEILERALEEDAA